MKKLLALLLILPLFSFGQGQFPVGGNSDTIRFGNIKVVNEGFYNTVPTNLFPETIPAWQNVHDNVRDSLVWIRGVIRVDSNYLTSKTISFWSSTDSGSYELTNWGQTLNSDTPTRNGEPVGTQRIDGKLGFYKNLKYMFAGTPQAGYYVVVIPKRKTNRIQGAAGFIELGDEGLQYYMVPIDTTQVTKMNPTADKFFIINPQWDKKRMEIRLGAISITPQAIGLGTPDFRWNGGQNVLSNDSMIGMSFRNNRIILEKDSAEIARFDGNISQSIWRVPGGVPGVIDGGSIIQLAAPRAGSAADVYAGLQARAGAANGDVNFYIRTQTAAGVPPIRFTVQHDGNVGVGDTTPVYMFTVGLNGDSLGVNTLGFIQHYPGGAFNGQTLVWSNTNTRFERGVLTLAGLDTSSANHAVTTAQLNTKQNLLPEVIDTAIVSTTNATPTTIYTLPLTVSGQYLTITADTRGKSTNDYYRGVKTVLMRNISGTISTLGTVADITTPMADAALSTATFTVTQSGTNVLVQVTGVLATNINWKTIIRYKYN